MTPEQRLDLLAYVARSQTEMLRAIAVGESWATPDYWDAVVLFESLTAAAA